MFDEYIDNLKNDIVRETCNLINIPSVSIETQNPDMPFGEGAKKTLDYALDLGNRLGFRTKNIDNYCGYIEFGEGENLLGIIGHLDVVPSGDGWDTPPFSSTIKDNIKINSRVRLILGINEEKDWKCIKHYKEKEELPTIGFSPDADFPCIYAEKGIATVYLKDDFTKYKDYPIKISNIDCNNNAINVVPKICNVTLDIDSSKINLSEVTNFIKNKINDFDISYSIQCTKSASWRR